MSTDSASPTAPSGRHPISVAHLVMGLVFAGFVVIWALFETDSVVGHDLRWLLPIPWLFAGGAGLLATAVRPRRRKAPATPTSDLPPLSKENDDD
ncbi:hypothetical protein [Nocardioides acrostichi]|uniref:Uncharacterized protein n=1 Tax=Nocardioides acrostichi TaxID=2784339 RepID=A0A930V100_9ACTN|nr:hypothetical protein [Nocardioides acrostichi]MBF4161732.1 hypothetical protein [Nocardioides acrostichi]